MDYLNKYKPHLNNGEWYDYTTKRNIIASVWNRPPHTPNRLFNCFSPPPTPTKNILTPNYTGLDTTKKPDNQKLVDIQLRPKSTGLANRDSYGSLNQEKARSETEKTRLEKLSRNMYRIDDVTDWDNYDFPTSTPVNNTILLDDAAPVSTSFCWVDRPI